MTEVERIEEWRGQAVLDRQGEPIGKLEEVFYDSVSGRALLLAVKSGRLRSRSRLVPLEGATVGREHVRIAYERARVEGAAETPSADKIDAATIDGLESTYGVKLPDDLELWSASEMEARRAAAEAALRRAEELEQAAQKRVAESEAARRQAQGAASDAHAAEKAAEEAKREAEKARREADRYS
jgi:PRC-barrel domain